MAQEQQVSLAQGPEPIRARGFERSVEDAFQQLPGLGGGQGLELEAGQVLVLPQGRDRVRSLFPGTEGDQDRGRPSDDQAVHHHRGELVELMGVVDDHQRRGPGRRAQRSRRAAHELGRVGAQVAECPFQRTERRKPGRGRRVDPADVGPGPRRLLHRLAGQPGFPDSDRAGQHDPAGRLPRAQCPRHEAKLLVPAGERPRRCHATRLPRTVAAQDLLKLRGGYLQEWPHRLGLHPQQPGDPLWGLTLVAEAERERMDRGECGESAARREHRWSYPHRGEVGPPQVEYPTTRIGPTRVGCFLVNPLWSRSAYDLRALPGVAVGASFLPRFAPPKTRADSAPSAATPRALP